MQELQDFRAAPPAAMNGVGRTSSHVAAVGNAHQIPSPAPIIATQHVLKAYEKQDQSDRQIIGAIEGAGSIVMLPLMLDMVTALLSKILTLGGTLDATKWGGMVNGMLRPMFRAARTTELQDIGNYWNRVTVKRHELNVRGGNDKLQVKADEAFKRLKTRGQWNVESTFGNNVEAAMTKRIRGFAPLLWLDDKVAEFARWRSGKLMDSAKRNLLGNADAGIAPLHEQLKSYKHQSGLINKTTTQVNLGYSKGFIESVAKLKDINDPKQFAESARSVIEAHRQEVAKVLEKGTPAERKIANKAALAIRQALRHVDTGGHPANAWFHIGNGEGSAIAKALRALPKGLGKASVLHVAFGAGAALLTAAKFMDGGRENRLESHLIKDFAADVYGVRPDQVTKDMLVGKDAHPLVSEVAKAAMKAKGGRGVHNALHAGFEVANVATLKGLGAGGMLLLPWYGAPGMPGIEQMTHGMLIGEQSTLQAYQALKSPQLPDEQKVACTRVLIASIPGFAKNHGIDNRQIDVMANDLVGQGLTGQQILKIVATPDKIIPMAKAAQQKLDAQAAEAKAADPKASETAAKAPETMLAAGKPASKVDMAEASHEGRVQGLQKAQGM